jgi:putative flippase GtrA
LYGSGSGRGATAASAGARPERGTARGIARRSELGRVVRFLAVGVLNTVVGLGTIYACKYFGGMGDVPANMVGYAVGLTHSFFWNRQWTFAHTGAALPAAARFALVFLVAYAVNLLVVTAAIRAGVNDYVAQAAGIFPYTALFYLGSRFLAFRE